MNKEELIAFLKENLTIEIKENSAQYGSAPYHTIYLKLCDEVISEQYLNSLTE